MGTRFRKSKNFGPLRINISKSGIGYSVGNKYVRVTHTADGKKRTTLNVPGTGISYVEESGSRSDHPENRRNEEETGNGGYIKFVVYLAILIILLFACNGKSAADEYDDAPEIEIAATEETEPEEAVIVVHIANKSTKKYHEYGCKAAPKESSKSYWLVDKTNEELEKLGYTHCKNCMDFPEKTLEADDSATDETIAHAPSRYNDGFICFADRNTKIYHNTWCVNAPEFGSSNCYSDHTTAEKIESEGFKPCAKCIW